MATVVHARRSVGGDRTLRGELRGTAFALIFLGAVATTSGCHIPLSTGWRLYAKLDTYYCTKDDTVGVRLFLDDSRGRPVAKGVSRYGDMRGVARWPSHETKAKFNDGRTSVGSGIGVGRLEVIVRRPDRGRVWFASDGKSVLYDEAAPDGTERESGVWAFDSPFKECVPLEVATFYSGPGHYRLWVSAVAVGGMRSEERIRSRPCILTVVDDEAPQRASGMEE